MTNYSFIEAPALQKVLDDNDINTYDKTEAVLYQVRNFSSSLWFCTSAVQTSSIYWNEHFKNFKSGGHFFLSMLQNFLGSVISLTNIYFSMEENVKVNNNFGVWYDTARIVRILIFFEPVELTDDDFVTYDPNRNGDDDLDNIPDPDVNQDLLDEEEQDIESLQNIDDLETESIEDTSTI